MTITARIEEIRTDRVRARFCSDDDCSGCQGCSLGKKSKPTMVEAENRRGLPLTVGDTVEIFLSPGKAIKAGFFVLIFPLLLFFVLYALARRLLGIENEAVNILIGAVGIAGGLLLNLAANKLRKKPDLPEVTRVIGTASVAAGTTP